MCTMTRLDRSQEQFLQQTIEGFGGKVESIRPINDGDRHRFIVTNSQDVIQEKIMFALAQVRVPTESYFVEFK